MLPSISESIGKLIDGLILLLSGAAGLVIPLFGIFALFALAKWFLTEPVKAFRLTVGGSIMFLSIFVAPLCSYAFDLQLQDRPLLFLASVLVCVYFGVKIGTKVMGKHGNETS